MAILALVRAIFIGVAEVKPDEMNLRDNEKKESRYRQLWKKINEAATGRMEKYSHLKFKKSK